MSSSSRTVSTTTLTIAGVTALAGLAGYLAYFDYKRRNDAEFRRQLRKEKKKVEKAKAKAPKPETESSTAVTRDELRAALEKVRNEEMPASPEEREQYFMGQVGMGEQLCQQGPMFALPAAMCFYRALRVYPNPVELYIIYEKTVPPPIFQMVMEMTNLDVKDRIEGYYEYFPSKAMNVSVKVVDFTDTDGSTKKRKIMVAAKDLSTGEIIYKEQPIVAVLDPDLQSAGTYCSHCLRAVSPGSAITAGDDPLSSVYCSKACELNAYVQYYRLLFSSDSPLPGELSDGESAEAGLESRAARAAAQAKFAAFLKTDARERAVPHLLARFIARQVAVETTKLMPKAADGPTAGAMTAGLPEIDGPKSVEYSLWDHVERLRYLETSVTDEEQEMMVELLHTSLPGLESFLSEDRHATLRGKLQYNAIGVCYPPSAEESMDDALVTLAGRNDKPISKERPEDQERTRTPFGTSRQIGTGLYLASCYIGHSCAPSARPSFQDGNSQLTLIANKDLKAGEELTIAYVDVTQHADENVLEARKRRRFELARGWRFACPCERCVEEAAHIEEGAQGAEDVPVEMDESKEEEVVTRVEGQVGGA